MDDTAEGFHNERVDPAVLPDYSQVPLEPVVRGYTAHSVLTHAALGLGGAIAVSVAVGLLVDVGTGLVAGGAAAVLLGGALSLYGLLYARRFGWAIRDHDVITHAGVWWRKSVVLPVVRIQHVETASGPLERALGTRRVQAFSAGSGSADLIVYGLDPDRAQQVRAYLLDRIAQAPGGHERD